MSGISVVLPVYRNAEALAALHARLIRALEAEAAGVRIDLRGRRLPRRFRRGAGRVGAARRARADHPHDRNQGQRLAVWHGLEAARGEIVITMDADLQDPPEAIPLLLVDCAPPAPAQSSRGGAASIRAACAWPLRDSIGVFCRR